VIDCQLIAAAATGTIVVESPLDGDQLARD
jgi:hypothetical protein